MSSIFEIKDIMNRVLKAIQKDRRLLCLRPKTTGWEDKRITIENLECLAGNHLFDDHPELFEITKNEGHKIRAYFQARSGNGNYSFFPELRKEFPDMFESERQEYLNRINSFRNSLRLPIF